MATGSSLQSLLQPQNVYGNATDLANAKSTLGNTGYNYIDTSAQGYQAPTNYDGSIVVGGNGALGGVANSGNALRLAGADTNATQQAIQGYASQKASTVPQATDNSSQISDMYSQNLAASQAALKASIQASMGQYQDTIAKAPGTYQPLRDQASAAGASNMQNLQEMLANNGQQGGVNRTESTAVNSATEGNINKLNLQQQSVIDTDNKAITDLQAQGDIKGAQLVADNASAKIKALIDESNRVSTANTAAAQQTFQNGVSLAGLTGNYGGQQTLAGKSSDASIAASNANTVYQNLVNAGYPAEQAAKLAQQTAQTQGQNLQNTQQSITNQYLPQQEQAKINATNASANASNRSNTGSLATAKAPTASETRSATAAEQKASSQTLTGNIQTYLDQWASGKADGQNGRATQSDMLNYLKSNAGVLTQQGIDPNALATWVKNNYQWDKDANGNWVKVG